MRMMRVSPAELARALARPYASSRITRSPRLARCHAIHAPNTPAPITATSNVFALLEAGRPPKVDNVLAVANRHAGPFARIAGRTAAALVPVPFAIRSANRRKPRSLGRGLFFSAWPPARAHWQ